MDSMSEALNNYPKPPPTIIRAAIVEDRREIREALTMLINGTEGFLCTGAYRTMEEALDKIKRELPGVVLCDIGLPGMSGIEGIRILKERYPELLLLMLTVYDDDERIFDALCAGACGYLLKNTPGTLDREPKRSGRWRRADVSGSSAPSRRLVSRHPATGPVRLSTDTSRNAVAEAARRRPQLQNGSGRAWAYPSTPSHFHMRNIYDKLQVHSKSEAVAKALRDRIV